MLPVPVLQNGSRFNFQETPVATYLNNKLFKDAMFTQVKVFLPFYHLNDEPDSWLRVVDENSGLHVPRASISMR